MKPAHAGRTCEARKPTLASVQQGLQLAERTARALDASGAQVVVLARAGQDLQKHGIHWSHLGLAYKTAEGPWRVLHKLNRCGTAVAGVWRQGLGEFFLDDLWRAEAAYAVPTPAVQAQLLALLTGPAARSVALHTAPYSIVSYAWGRTYQQSNQWALETMAAALAPGGAVADRGAAQSWLRQQGYAPQVLRLGPLTRLGGRVGSANVSFDDHPPDQRYSGRIATVTVESVFDWLQRSRLAAAPVTVKM